MKFYSSIISIKIWKIVVSIPNGMKFYSFFETLLPSALRCFNSQRDEILRMKNLQDRFRRGVSIPNGMKFYAAMAIHFYSLQMSFNSQRDEILHPIYQPFHLFGGKFQFPTGWNSTKRQLQ